MATDRVCKVGGCDKPCIARGFCSAHYKRFMRGIDVLTDETPVRKFNTPCRVCGERAYGRGLCQTHYLRWKRRGTTDIQVTPRGMPAKFVAEAINFDGDDCLFWPYARDYYGRARMSVARRHQSVNRAVCEAVYGPPPGAEMQVAHSCGKGHLGCVNPKHLRWATQLENEADKLIHGTVARGEINGHAKLTREDVHQIRLYIKEGWACSAIAALYNVTSGAIRAIKRGKNWAWLE